MEKFEPVSGIAAPMPLVNIDTDMIIPKQFLKTIKRTGLGVNLFDEMRYDDNGDEIPEFVLNKPAYRKAEILVAGDNFGCGSSREHAPWALKDFGIRVVISTSFADIFHNNCFKNGILPVVLSKEQVDVLMDDADKGENARITVDLESQTVTAADGTTFSFEVDPFKKHCLLEGLDDIGLSMQKMDAIETFENEAPITNTLDLSALSGSHARTLILPARISGLASTRGAALKRRGQNGEHDETISFDSGRRRHRTGGHGAGQAGDCLVRGSQGDRLRCVRGVAGRRVLRRARDSAD